MGGEEVDGRQDRGEGDEEEEAGHGGTKLSPVPDLLARSEGTREGPPARNPPRVTIPGLRRVATKIFLAFGVSLAAFALVSAFGIVRLHDLGRKLRLLSEGYLPSPASPPRST